MHAFWNHPSRRWLLAGVAPALALLAVAPHAQKGSTKVGFIDTQKVLAAAPGGAGIAAYRKQVEADLAKQATAVKTLQQKVSAGSASAADRQALSTAVQTYQAAGQRYQKQLQSRSAPVAKTVDAAVARAAKAQGYSLVIDGGVARQLGLVIYADSKSTDLTQAVIKQLGK